MNDDLASQMKALSQRIERLERHPMLVSSGAIEHHLGQTARSLDNLQCRLAELTRVLILGATED
jgi:hypothetical protein